MYLYRFNVMKGLYLEVEFLYYMYIYLFVLYNIVWFWLYLIFGKVSFGKMIELKNEFSLISIGD